MTDEIKEKLLKKIEEYSRFPYKPVTKPTIKEIYEIMLKQHEETSKAKDEEFIKILDALQKSIMRNGNLSYRIIEDEYGEYKNVRDKVLNNIVCEYIEEIKQKLEKKE